MITTPLLDSIVAAGTGVSSGIRLADGLGLTLTVRPGATVAEEVFLYRGLTAPDRPEWANEDPWEPMLIGGANFNLGKMYLDVPITAVRDLIVQHGGEHEDQSSAMPPLECDTQNDEEAVPVPTWGPETLATLAHLHGILGGDFTTWDVYAAFGHIVNETGLDLVCIWDYRIEDEFGGEKRFYAESESGALREISTDLREWLTGHKETPGPVETWVGAPVAPIDVVSCDGFHSYARRIRRS